MNFTKIFCIFFAFFLFTFFLGCQDEKTLEEYELVQCANDLSSLYHDNIDLVTEVEELSKLVNENKVLHERIEIKDKNYDRLRQDYEDLDSYSCERLLYKVNHLENRVGYMTNDLHRQRIKREALERELARLRLEDCEMTNFYYDALYEDCRNTEEKLKQAKEEIRQLEGALRLL